MLIKKKSLGIIFSCIISFVIVSNLLSKADNNFETELKNAGYSLNDVKDSEQVIIVNSSNKSFYYYEYSNNAWSFSGGFTEGSGNKLYVGKGGVGTASEGSSITPKGVFGLGIAFGKDTSEFTKIDYRVLNSNCYWVDDSDSIFYNKWVESSTIFWNSAEHLNDYVNGAYKYAIFIEYNVNPVRKGEGSAFFLHCSTGSSTQGCVAIPENYMVSVLKWLDDSKNPKIVIS